jgi:hypothetical protein
MRSYFWSVIFTLAFATLPGPAPAGEAGQPVQLFNGADLSGWSHYLVDSEVGMEDVWSVQDGILVCRGEPLGHLHTTSEYTSYELVVEWRWAPGTEPGNSGVLMRINGETKAIPRSYEAQLKSGDAGDVYGFWGMPLSGDESRKRQATGHELLGDMVGFAKIEGHENPPGEWNRYEIRLAGPDIVIQVNGKTVNEATDAEVLAGSIGLQSEGGEIHFRKVELTPID